MKTLSKFIVKNRQSYAAANMGKKRDRLKLDQVQVIKETSLTKTCKKMYTIRAYCPSKNCYLYLANFVRGQGQKFTYKLQKARLFKMQNHAIMAMRVLQANFQADEFLLNPLEEFEQVTLLITIEQVN